MAADDDEPPAIAFVGRPNVGKSSLLNSLLGDSRMIVSDIPGTTRDAIDTTIPWGRSEVVLIDTAGIRKRGKVASGPAAEKYSTMRALKAISRADVAVLVLDAHDGLTAQDAHVAGYVIEEGKGLIIAVNKWDIVEDKTHKTFEDLVVTLRRELAFIDYAPIVSISAKTGQRVQKVLELAVDVWGERRRRISTGRAQPPRRRRDRADAAGRGQGEAAQDPLRDPGGRRAADVRVLHHRSGVRALLVPALPREPAARRVRVHRHADPARVPRAGPREAPEEGASGPAGADGRPVARRRRASHPNRTIRPPRAPRYRSRPAPAVPRDVRWRPRGSADMDDDDERPIGIPLLGIISFLGGIVLCFIGIVLMGVIIFGDIPTGSGSFIAGAITFGDRHPLPGGRRRGLVHPAVGPHRGARRPPSSGSAPA